MNTLSPFSRPVYVMAKPAGSACNLRCRYCYYLEKAAGQMSDATLEKFIQQYIEAQTADCVLFTWHGGEPTLRGLEFYRRVVKLQKRYARGRAIDNSLQTNGMYIDEEWARFLRDENWLVGISIDGPEDMHNAYRVDAAGHPTWKQVMSAINLLDRYDVEWNAMATVNHVTAARPQAFYHFFRDIGCHYLQFTPVVERRRDTSALAAVDEAGVVTPESVRPDEWGNFLCTVFDEWVRRDVGNVFVQLFDATLAGWMGVEPGVCSMAPTCGHAAVIDATGDVYSCDHFVFPQYRLGNILGAESLTSMLYSERQQAFGRAKRDALPKQCRSCQWLPVCNGECPRLRFAVSNDGEPGLNYLCKGYRRYFEHVAPAMDFMRNELLHERPPANIMLHK